LQQSASLTIFRQCLSNVISKMPLHLKFGRPPQRSVDFRNQMLRLFASKGRSAHYRRCLLMHLPNGDWENLDAIEYYVPPGREQVMTPPVVRHVLTVGLSFALMGSRPSLYPRHRWTGAEVSIDDIAIGVACHGLAVAAYRAFVEAMGAKRGQPKPEEPAEVMAELPLLPSFEDAGADEQAFGTEHLDEAAAHGFEPGATGEGESHAQQNARYRKVGLEWMKVNPLGKLIVVRAAIEPLSALLAGHLRLAGGDFDRDQDLAISSSLLAGSSGIRREYRVEIAACNDLELKCVSRLRDAFSDIPLWSCMPALQQTFSMRCLAFRLLSRIGCLVAMFLLRTHRTFPIKMFQLLRHPDRCTSFSELPNCLLDEWSKDLKVEHPTLSGDVFQAKLVTAALLAAVNIADVESKHAALRRHLAGRSVQTHALSLVDLSAEWILHQARRLRSRYPGVARRIEKPLQEPSVC